MVNYIKELVISQKHRRLALVAASVVTLLAIMVATMVYASTPLDGVGYLDFSYPGGLADDLTGEKAESKLWWNDGFWWGSIYNEAAAEYHIYRLNWGTQTWEDTGVALDDREVSKADTYWDATTGKLYVVSHLATKNSGQPNDPLNWGRFYRYTYDAATETYTLDSGFPVNVNEDSTETLVLDKDSTSRLWVSYVSRIPPSTDYTVYVNSSDDNGATWGTPFVLPFVEAHVAQDDISSIVAFTDDGGDKIGVMWSNQISNTVNFATHPDNVANPESGWTLEAAITMPNSADDHVSLRSLQTLSSGQMFAAVKTGATVGTDPLVGLVARDTNGAFSFHTYSTKTDNDTNPTLLIDEEADKVYIFVTGKPGGSMICYKSADITTPLSNMSFTPGNCGTEFIEDSTYDSIDNATSTKQNVNSTTGIVVLGSNFVLGRTEFNYYVHNVLGDPPPVVTGRSPGINAVDVPAESVVTATFSKAMNASTLNGSSFTVEDSVGTIAGSITYNVTSRTATFTPAAPLKANTTYTVELTSAIQDTSGQALFGTGPVRETWSFTTQAPTVQFATTSYGVNEGVGTATITVTLNTASSDTVMVNYATSDGTAAEGSDYTAASGALTFTPDTVSQSFDVSITDDLLAEPGGDETINLALSSPSNASLGIPGTAVLSIVDNDGPPSVQFNSAALNANENSGSANVEVTLSHATLATVTVQYSTGGGTATAGDDYTATSSTLTFAPNVTSQSFPVALLNDALDEAAETINLALSNPTNADPGTLFNTVLTINDDDPTPTVQFSDSAYSVVEAGGTAVIEVTLSAPSGQTVTVNYATSDSTATADSDYTAASGTLTYLPGQTSQSFSVSILNDALDEADNEQVQLTLTPGSNGSLGDPNTAALTIEDDDPMPTVQFSNGFYTVVEEDGAITVNVTLNAASAKTVAVDYATSDGTANAGDDYTPANGTLNFLPGETSQSFTITIAVDAESEADETINLTLSNPDDATLGANSTATIRILGEEQSLFLPVVVRH